jgi:hypothetical protein
VRCPVGGGLARNEVTLGRMRVIVDAETMTYDIDLAKPDRRMKVQQASGLTKAKPKSYCSHFLATVLGHEARVMSVRCIQLSHRPCTFSPST